MLTLFGWILVPLGNEVIEYSTNDKGPNLREITLTQFIDTSILHIRLDDFEDWRIERVFIWRWRITDTVSLTRTKLIHRGNRLLLDYSHDLFGFFARFLDIFGRGKDLFDWCCLCFPCFALSVFPFLLLILSFSGISTLFFFLLGLFFLLDCLILAKGKISLSVYLIIVHWSQWRMMTWKVSTILMKSISNNQFIINNQKRSSHSALKFQPSILKHYQPSLKIRIRIVY